MSVLVIASHDNASLKEATGKVVTAAQAIGGDIDILVAGHNAGPAIEAAAKIGGVRKVLSADGATLAKQLAEPMEALIVGLAANYDAILFATDTSGKNVAPRVAAKLDVMQISGVIGVEGPKTFVRTMYAGNAVVTVETADPKVVATVQGTSFKAAPAGGATPVETIAAPTGPFKSAFVTEVIAKSDRPELVGAKRVVSGGRALGSDEKFKEVIEPLADQLGAAVGASRAAVDAGYAPNDYQVGQTGKVVAPELYVAIGISGAIQHLAGMKDSKVIVAINKDEEAPIFQVADYGIVGDLFTVVPEFRAALSKIGVN
jgi:electron transfer flavoprotein alpha subunit